MKSKYVLSLLVALISVLLSGVAVAQSGENTYKQVCANCHGTGVLNAPKFGDKAKWAPLIAEGQVTLTAYAYFGVRGMHRKAAIRI